jgi:hypothetical protein
MERANYSIEVDACTDSEWSRWLDLFNDASIYQTWSYGSVRWGDRSTSRIVLKLGGEVLSLAQLRIVRPAALKFGLAHLRWGPVLHRKAGELDLQAARRMAGALRDEYVVKRRLFLRVHSNAFEETDRGRVFAAAFSDYESEEFSPGDSYRTMVLDLAPPLDVLRRNLDQKWRNQLNRAERNGLSIREDATGEQFAIFVRLYDEMMARKKLSG